jgi:hypothetical protein
MLNHFKIRVFFTFFVFISFHCARKQYVCGNIDEFIRVRSEVIKFQTIGTNDTSVSILKGIVLGELTTSVENKTDTLAYANLEFWDANFAISKKLYTNEKGRFEITLPAGTYPVSCSYTGMNKTVITNATILEGEIKELIFQLGVGFTQDTIDIWHISK